MKNFQRNRQIVALRRKGVGPREIARRMGLTPGIVVGVLDREGLCASSVAAQRERRELVRALKLMRDSGMTFAALGAAFGMPRTTVSGLVRRGA